MTALEPENQRVIADYVKEKQFPGGKRSGRQTGSGLVRCRLVAGSQEAEPVSMLRTQDGLDPILNACYLGFVKAPFPILHQGKFISSVTYT